VLLNAVRKEIFLPRRQDQLSGENATKKLVVCDLVKLVLAGEFSCREQRGHAAIALAIVLKKAPLSRRTAKAVSIKFPFVPAPRGLLQHSDIARSVSCDSDARAEWLVCREILGKKPSGSLVSSISCARAIISSRSAVRPLHRVPGRGCRVPPEVAIEGKCFLTMDESLVFLVECKECRGEIGVDLGVIRVEANALRYAKAASSYFFTRKNKLPRFAWGCGGGGSN